MFIHFINQTSVYYDLHFCPSNNEKKTLVTFRNMVIHQEYSTDTDIYYSDYFLFCYK